MWSNTYLHNEKASVNWNRKKGTTGKPSTLKYYCLLLSRKFLAITVHACARSQIFATSGVIMKLHRGDANFTIVILSSTNLDRTLS